jgi:cell division protein FtsI (penicillin-binding protein 3)
MQPKDQIMARMYVVITLVSLVPILVGFQVLRITVLEGGELRKTVEEQSTEYEPIPPARGIIMDAKGRPMADNIERYQIAVDPSAYGYRKGADRFFERVSELTKTQASVLRRKVAARPESRYVSLAKNVIMSGDDIAFFKAMPFAVLDRTTKRQYNYGSNGAHFIGFANQYGGIAGLEGEFEALLAGSPGQRIKRKTARGSSTPIPGGVLKDPQHGTSLVLTVDVAQQAILEEELRKGTIEAEANWGAAVALDVNTGAILAMANYPTFDPNMPGSSMHGKRNHVITDRFEPGSTMKVLPAVAAVESGVISMQDSIETGSGYLKHEGWDLRDTHANGTITYHDVIKLSSNIGTALVSDNTDKGELYKYARAFGFNQKTRIELPGEATTVVRKIPDWNRSTRSAISRGYAIVATPLQMALAYAALANGGELKRPFIVERHLDADGNTTWEAEPHTVRRVFDEDTAQKLTPAFESVTGLDGTAPRAAVKGLRIAGKTGTAMKARENGYGYIQGAYKATFVGFYPVENPQVVLLVVMDDPQTSIYGGMVAAPVFRNTTERWLATMPEVAQYLAPDSMKAENLVASVPVLEGKPSALAARMARAHGLKEGSKTNYSALVTNQNVPAGEEAWPGRFIELDARIDSISVMPDVTGLSLRDAYTWLRHLGINVSIEGHGVVWRQSPDPGSPMPSMASISLN